MQHLYFGGDGADLGNVRALIQRSFADLVTEVFGLGHPAMLNLTKDQFFALDKRARDKAKRVPYVVPSVFGSTPSRRLTECAKHANLIFLDIDTAPDGTSPAAPFYNDPASLRSALHPYAFAAYTTARSTPEAPRIRIVVSADKIPLERYADAVNYVAALLRLPSVTTESKVAVQPMYVPTMFKGMDPITEHPLFLAVPQGEAVTLKDFEDLQEPDAPPEENADAPKSSELKADVNDLDFVRPTSDDITLDDVKEALSHLDPDMSYPDWLEIAAALRHQFPREPDASAAYALFDEWSAKGKKYSGADETAAKWRSLKATPKGRAPITIRSLLYKAAEQGWSSAKVVSKCYATAVKWLSDPARTGHELMNDATKVIVSVPLITPLERGALISQLQEALKARKLKVSRTDLMKDLRKTEQLLRGKSSEPQSSTPDSQLPKWARGLVYVMGADQFYQRHTGRRFSPAVFDTAHDVFLMTGESETGRPPLRPRDYLLNVCKCPRVDYYRYDPAHPEEVFVQEGPLRYVNIYVPTHPEPDAADRDAAGEVFWSHVCNLIDGDFNRKRLVDFLAYHVQCPGGKINWATLIQGAQGCGKTALADAMRAVLGHAHVKAVDAHVLMESQYNDWAYGAQLVAMEEVRIVGKNRYSVMDKLKPCISNSRISINEKYESLVQMPNCTNYLMFTNHHDALAVTDEDRRYFVLKSPLQTKDQIRALGEDYFVKLFKVFETRAAGLRCWFQDWDIGPDFDPLGRAPITADLLDLQEASATPLQAAIRHALQDNVHPLVSLDLVSTTSLRHALAQEAFRDVPDQTLASVLREMGFVSAGRRSVNGERHRLWVPRDGTISADDAGIVAELRMATQPATNDFSIL